MFAQVRIKKPEVSLLFQEKHSEPSIVVCAISTLLCAISLEQAVF